MLRLTFRTQLLLAMMLIVAGVSIATLVVTQRRVQENYERLFRQQFDRQIGFFTALQEARLGAVKERCASLAKSVRLIAGLSEAEVDVADLYKIADDELRYVSGDLGGGMRPGGSPAQRRLHSAFFQFLDAEGKPLLRPDHPRTRAMNLAIKRRLETKRAVVRDVLASAEPQQVGYLPLSAETNASDPPRPGLLRAGIRPADENEGSPVLHEVIFTRVIDSSDGRVLGALLLGFALPDLVPAAAHVQLHGSNALGGDLIQTGIMIENRFYANPDVITASLGEEVARVVSERVFANPVQHADFPCRLNGAEYRVFYETLNERSAFPPAYQVCLYPMAEARREQADLRWRILGSGGAALVVGLGLSLFIAHGLSAPIRDLVAGTGEIQRGNFQVRVPVRRQDEMGRLADSFNEMAGGLAQKEKYRTVLNMVADEKIAHQLMRGELALGGELREITVLFCDIRGFTALTQNMPPVDVIELLNEHMTALTRVVKAHHGVLDKFVGDLLMAVFGAPLAHDDDTFNAARCALELQQVRETLNRTSRHQIQIGIGLATGTVVAGCMGSVERLNYTVLGERVNLGSRLCSQAKAGEILVDEATQEKLAGRVTGEPLGEMQLKGFDTPVRAYRLCRLQAMEGRG